MLKTGMLGIFAGASFFLLLSNGIQAQLPEAAIVQPAQLPDSHSVPQTAEAGWRAEERVVVDMSSRSSQTIHVPGASFIKLHISEFNLPRHVILEVGSPSGAELYQYSSRRKDPYTFNPAEGDDGVQRFSAMSVSGDTVVLRLLGEAKYQAEEKYRVVVDYYTVGYPQGAQKDGASVSKGSTSSGIESAGSGSGHSIKTQCGLDDQVDAICTEPLNPDEYATSRAVVRLLINGSQNCTAWRVGSGNHLLTNYHCIDSQAELNTTEVWFNFERTVCGGTGLEQEIKVTGAQYIAGNSTLDYALFSVNNFSLISEFGHLGLEVGEGELGDLIYIPQHGSGLPKKMAMDSDMDLSGLCEISDTDHTGYAWGTDLGYFCDTVGGSSGAPVLLRDSKKAIALHHFGGCVNSGVKMSLIWPQLSPHFGGVVPVGGEGEPSTNTPPDASFSVNCTNLNCAFNGATSSDPDGQVVTYAWTFGDGGTASGAQANHSYAGAGSYSVSLLVTDNEGASDSVSQVVNVDLPNANPVAAYSFSCNNRVCDFDAGLSSDSDGQIVSYGWNFGDGATHQSASALAQHEFAADGQYSVQLTVWDNDGAQAQAQSAISVSSTAVNQEPLASYTHSCTHLSCEFDASGSFDPDGVISSYSWDFGEGESLELGGPVKNHTFGEPGAYTVTLQVEDNQGAVSSHSVTINVVVIPPANIDLQVVAYKQRGSKRAILSWTGASGPSVSVFKDGVFLSEMLNTGEFTDSNIPKKAQTVTYQVCETDLSVCSQVATADF